jgi:hypothetical protein
MLAPRYRKAENNDVLDPSRGPSALLSLFRIGIVSHLISQVIVIFLVLALYRLLRPVKPERRWSFFNAPIN